MLPVLVVLVAGIGVGAGYGLRELSTPAAANPTGTVPAPTPTTTIARGEEPGPRGVELAADAKAESSSGAIQDLLQRHFDAINNLHYEGWQSTVTRQRAATFPEQRWLDQYRTTTDGAILVHRIEPTTTGAVVLISFTSIQDRELAPDKASDCLRWRVSYSVVVERGELRLGPSDPKTSQYEAC